MRDACAVCVCIKCINGTLSSIRMIHQRLNKQKRVEWSIAMINRCRRNVLLFMCTEDKQKTILKYVPSADPHALTVIPLTIFTIHIERKLS